MVVIFGVERLLAVVGSKKCFDAIGSKWKRVKCLLKTRRLLSDNNDKSNILYFLCVIDIVIERQRYYLNINSL